MRAKLRSSFALATFLFGVLVVYERLADPVQPTIAWTLLAWSMGFVMVGGAIRRGWLPLRWMAAPSAIISLTSSTLIIHLTGGPRSPFFSLIGMLPLAIAIFAPQTRLLTLLACGLSLTTATVLGVLAGLSPRELGLHVSCFAIIGMVAMLGVEMYQRLRDAEKAAQRERLTTLEQLSQSERRRVHAERERAEVERLALVGQLASGVAHEVNNPLAFVKSNLYYLKEELQREGGPEDWGELTQALTEAQQGVLRIQQIITDLRSFSREDVHPESQGWPESALHEARRLASVRLHSLGEVTLDIPPGLPSVRLGQRHLVQVLVNLLLNAADAVESAVPARRAHIRVKAQRLDDAVRLEVEDNGPGIPEHVLPRIFDPFFTTRPVGKSTGLGLAVCREYVTRADGTLFAQNRAEGGARFIIVLPEASGPRVESTPDSSSHP